MTTQSVDLGPLDDLLGQLPEKTTDVIPILQHAQAIYGYLPQEVLQHIASRLDISVGKVYGVATFYAQFYLEKKGKHTLRLCDGTACHVKGAPGLMSAVKDEFKVEPGQTSADGEFSEEIVYCLGSCAMAPVGVVDGQVVGRLRPEKLIPRLKKSITPPQNA